MPLFSALAKLLAAGYTFLAEFHLCVVYPLWLWAKSKDIKRVHSVKNAVFRTSHGFAKLTSFTRHQKQIKYSKKNLICQQPVPYIKRVHSSQNKSHARSAILRMRNLPASTVKFFYKEIDGEIRF